MADNHTPSEHAGFDDWIEVFQAGKHTDSAGKTATWSPDDLDQIVANFSAEQPAPLVIGHPKTDSPAWGWTSAIKRVGNKLLAKFSQVPETVANAVREGRYRNRSVKLAQGDHGWKLIHVGLLGAAPPAVEGLASIAFEAEPEGVTYEFNGIDGAGLSLIARGMQKLRELILAHFGADEADRYAPQSEIDNLNNLADMSSREVHVPADAPNEPTGAFSAADHEDPAMDEKLKAERDAEKARADAAEAKLAAFAAHDRQATADAMVEKLLADGKLLPAQTTGLAEFLASEPEAATFEFAAGDGDAKVTKARSEYLFALLDALPKQIELGQRHSGDDPAVGDNAESIVSAAHAYQAAEHAKGNEIAWHEAVSHVSQEGK